MKTASALFLVLTVGVLGCESEERRQHHLYNLQKCRAETDAADAIAFDFKDDSDLAKAFTANGQSLRDVKQRLHESHAAECMANEEKTTIEYQQEKHDDYGKVAARP